MVKMSIPQTVEVSRSMKNAIRSLAALAIFFAVAPRPAVAGNMTDYQVIQTISLQVAPKLNYAIPMDAMTIKDVGGTLGRCFVIAFDANRNDFLEIFYVSFLLGGLASQNVAEPIKHVIARITIQSGQPETKFWVSTAASAELLLNKQIDVQQFIDGHLIKLDQ